MPSLFANFYIPGSDFSLGMGAYAPFGLGTTYEPDFTRFAAERTELKTLYVTPALSWRPSEYFSIGGGVSFVHASGTFTRALCFDAFTGCTAQDGPLEGRLRLTDVTNTYAYNLGLLVKPVDNIKFGLTYRSRADLRFSHANVKLGGSFSPTSVQAKVRPVTLPPVIDAGLFWRINQSWGAEFIYEYTRWSEFKNFKATFLPVPIFLPFAAPIPGFNLPQRWRNTSTLGFGSFYNLDNDWQLRGGFAVDQSPIPNKTLNPAIPGADFMTLNAGVGYKWQKLSVDFGYMAVFYKTRRVTNGELEGLPATGIPYTGAPGKDKYKTFNNFVSLSLNYRF